MKRNLRLAAIALPMVLCACSAPVIDQPSPSPPPRFGTDDQHLLTAVFQDVADTHLHWSPPGTFAMAALQSLHGVDPLLSFDRQDQTIVLRRAGDEVRLAAPPTSDADGWGALVTQMLDRTYALSPVVDFTPKDALVQEMVNHALATLDRYSRYAVPAEARRRRAQLYGGGGIGIMIEPTDDGAQVASVLPGSPAAEAGIKNGDRLLALDGTAVLALGPDALQERLEGEPGTPLDLVIAHGLNPAPVDISLRRSLLVEPTVALETKGSFAWLRITYFNSATGSELARSLAMAHRMLGSNLHGIVLDLRDNPGGLLSAAIDVAELFLDGGPVISTVGRVAASNQSYMAPANGAAESLPLVILINGETASAAEIVSASLQDRGRAVVVGSASFGKGTVQQALRLPNDGDLMLTWAKLLPPEGYALDEHGVIPTVCTAHVAEDAALAQADLVRLASAVPDLALPRDHLDDAGWRALHQRCPAHHGLPAVDSAVSEVLLDQPALYRQALGTAVNQSAERP